jgi:hypothetical protein
LIKSLTWSFSPEPEQWRAASHLAAVRHDATTAQQEDHPQGTITLLSCRLAPTRKTYPVRDR